MLGITQANWIKILITDGYNQKVETFLEMRKMSNMSNSIGLYPEQSGNPKFDRKGKIVN